jgi:hypothetical protein
MLSEAEHLAIGCDRCPFSSSAQISSQFSACHFPSVLLQYSERDIEDDRQSSESSKRVVWIRKGENVWRD